MNTIEKLNMTYVLVFVSLVFFILTFTYFFLQPKARKRLLFVTESIRLTFIAVALLAAIFGTRGMVAENMLNAESQHLVASYAHLKEGAEVEKKYICAYKPPKSKRVPAGLEDVLPKMKVACKILSAFATRLLTSDFTIIKAEWDDLIFPENCPLCIQSKERISNDLQFIQQKQIEIAKLEKVVLKDTVKNRALILMPWILSLIVCLSFFKLTSEYFFKSKYEL